MSEKYNYQCRTCGGSSVGTEKYIGSVTTMSGVQCKFCGDSVLFLMPEARPDIKPPTKKTRKLTIKERLCGYVNLAL